MLEVAGRTALIYVLMLVMIRVLGKRTVGNLTAFDMLVALMMGDLAGDAIYGDASMGAAVVAVVSLGALHYGNSWLGLCAPGRRPVSGRDADDDRPGGPRPARRAAARADERARSAGRAAPRGGRRPP